MKVLVATHELQGAAVGDYCWTVDGELVTALAFECASPDECGCGRGFGGLASCRATTTTMVVEHSAIDRVGLAGAIEDSLDRQGWLAHLEPDEVAAVVEEHVEAIELVGTSFPHGTVLSRSGPKVWDRGRVGSKRGRRGGIDAIQRVSAQLVDRACGIDDDVRRGYDVIGDVHGQADKLTGLLDALDYEERDGVWRHPDRTAVFVGDLIDRGPQQLETIGIVRPMVRARSARIVLGNHEFNAIAYATPDPGKSGEYLRTRYDHHRQQHQAFLDAVGEDSPQHLDVIEWFKTLPVRLDLGGLRVVHACWDESSFEVMAHDTLTGELIEASSRKGTPTYAAVEIVLKGPEIELGETGYFDQDGDWRTRARFRWWDPEATTLRAAAELPGRSSSCPTIPSIRRCDRTPMTSR